MDKSTEASERRAALMRAGAQAAQKYREGIETRMGSFTQKLNEAMREAAERRQSK